MKIKRNKVDISIFIIMLISGAVPYLAYTIAALKSNTTLIGSYN